MHGTATLEKPSYTTIARQEKPLSHQLVRSTCLDSPILRLAKQFFPTVGHPELPYLQSFKRVVGVEMRIPERELGNLRFSGSETYGILEDGDMIDCRDNLYTKLCRSFDQYFNWSDMPRRPVDAKYDKPRFFDPLILAYHVLVDTCLPSETCHRLCMAYRKNQTIGIACFVHR